MTCSFEDGNGTMQTFESTFSHRRGGTGWAAPASRQPRAQPWNDDFEQPFGWVGEGAAGHGSEEVCGLLQREERLVLRRGGRDDRPGILGEDVAVAVSVDDQRGHAH